MLRPALLVLVLLASSCQAEEQQPDPAVLAKLQAMVPAGWWHQPPLIPPEQDAWPQLSFARSKLAKVRSSDTPLWQAWLAGTSSRRVMSDDQVQLLSHWLDQQQDVLEIIDHTASLTGLNLPPASSKESQSRTLRPLEDLLTVDARVHAARGEAAAAWKAVRALQRLSNWATDASSSFIDDFVATSQQSKTCGVVTRVALDVGDAAAIEIALRSLPPERPIDILALLHRVFAAPSNLRALASAPTDGAGWAKVLREQAAIWSTLNTVIAPERAIDSDLQPHPEIELMEARGRVLDPVDAFDLEVKWCDAVTASSPSSWAELQHALDSPAGRSLAVRCGSALDMMSEGVFNFSAILFNKAAPPDDTKRRQQNEAMMTDLRRLLKQDPNPSGVLIAAGQTSVCPMRVQLAIDLEARRRLTRAALGLTLVRIRTGSLPDSLAVLAFPDLLGNLPKDPFDGAPLRYNAAKGLLWSVGKDLVDDGGDLMKDTVVELKARAR